MRNKAIFALAAVAVGCSSAPESSEKTSEKIGVAAGPTERATSQQLRAFDLLQKDTGKTWRWLQHDRFGTPAHLSTERTGMALLTAGADVGKVTRDFLRDHRELFRMRDPSAELELTRAVKDDLGMTHARFQQVTHGVPVTGAEIAVHYDAEGRLASIDANYVPDVEGLDLEPRIDVRAMRGQLEAEALAQSGLTDESVVVGDDGKLVVFALDGAAPRLAYEYTVRAVAGDHPAIWVTTVDAKTGEVIDRYDNLMTIEATAAGVLGDTKKFQVAQNGDGYVMIDTSRSAPIHTFTAGNQLLGNGNLGARVTSGTLTSWDTGGTGAGAAVDAHVHAGIVFDYYKTRFNRQGIDNLNGPMQSTAHFGQSYDNAFWDGQRMAYGDGATRYRPLSAGLDVVAHEFTHGMIQRTSNLRYENQPGALNEAVADIFGCFIEHASKPDATKNWQIGEVIAKGIQSGLLRDAKNPALGQQPAHMTQFRNTLQDNGGVHINSGIINQAAYLMTVGGVNPVSKVEVKLGVGWDKSEKLWYRANQEYFVTTTNFGQAAQGLLQAAKDLGFTADEQAIVDCSLKATGIAQGACAAVATTSPAPQSNAPGTAEPGAGAGAGPGSSTGAPGETDGNASEDPAVDGEESAEEKSGSGGRRDPGLPNYNSSSSCSAGPRGSTASDVAPIAGFFVALGLVLARSSRLRARLVKRR